MEIRIPICPLTIVEARDRANVHAIRGGYKDARRPRKVPAKPKLHRAAIVNCTSTAKTVIKNGVGNADFWKLLQHPALSGDATRVKASPVGSDRAARNAFAPLGNQPINSGDGGNLSRSRKRTVQVAPKFVAELKATNRSPCGVS